MDHKLHRSMNSHHLASRIRASLEQSDSRSKLVASLIACVFASDDPLVVAIDQILALHGYDLSRDAQLAMEVGMRIEVLREAFDHRCSQQLFNRAKSDDAFAIAVANTIARSPLIEMRGGFEFDSATLSAISSMLSASDGV